MQTVPVARQYFDSWNEHDADGINQLFAEGGTYTDPTTGGPLTGDAIGENATRLWSAFPDLNFEILTEDEASEHLTVAQWVMRGTNHGSMMGLPPTGREIELPGADFVTTGPDGITSVVGYFDSGIIPRQLGLQVLVQPKQVGPFTFGRATSVQAGNPAKPGAFSITILQSDTEEEQQQIADFSRKIATEMLAMPGFIGWTGLTVGRNMMTVTAWEEPDQAQRLMKEGTHRDAMRAFFRDRSEGGVASGGWTSVWSPAWINARWIRCESCGKMLNFDRQPDGHCTCGAPLPTQPSWW